MEIGLTAANITALFGTLFVLAFMPTASTMMVAARTTTFGLGHGVLTSVGIALGDITFILIAIYGLAQLADLMADQFVLIKYLGATYLIVMGLMLWRAKVGLQSSAESTVEITRASLLSSFLSGFLITLADQKAILFYLGLFPALLDLREVSLVDTGIILVVSLIAVGGPKCIYAVLANKASRHITNSKAIKGLNLISGGIMVGIGILLLVRS